MLFSSSRFSSLKLVVVFCALSIVALSCASAPADIPDGLSPAELIQRAQDSYDKDRYEQAVSYYLTLRERFPNDLPAQCAADYEIAFIRYKQNRLEEAKAGFRTLLARYDNADAALLPAHYQVLGEKILAKIDLEKK